MITSSDVTLALLSGAVGAIGSQFLAIWHTRKLEIERRAFEIDRTKLSVLRKIAGNRAAVSDKPILQQIPKFLEGLNEVMVVFSDSSEVSKALIQYKAALNTPNSNDRLTDLFKAISRDVGIDPTAFNDSFFLQPFVPADQLR